MPPRQIQTHCPNRHFDSVSCLKQNADRIPIPQSKIHFQLFRTLVDQKFLNFFFLLGSQSTPGTSFSPPLPRFQCFDSALLPFLQPFGSCLTRNPDGFCRRCVGVFYLIRLPKMNQKFPAL